MEHQRGHLDRSAGEVERGIADTLIDSNLPVHAAAHDVPKWLLNFEASRPVWLVEMIAECIGVSAYVFCGLGATASFYLGQVELGKVSGLGSLFTIGLSYGLAATFALTIAAPVSGGQLSPGFSFALSAFKGFPASKIPRYIFAQILGGFIASLCVYAQFKTSLDPIYAAMMAGGEEAVVFSPNGPAGIFALFPPVGTPLKYVFLNEFLANILLSLVVFSVIDTRNPFASYTTAPLLIGLAYAVIIYSFAINGLALNTARDLGGRFACGVIYGSKCFTASKGYTALAALTNIPATVLGGLLHTLLLSDSRKPIVTVAPAHPTASDNSMRVLTIEQDANLRALTRDLERKSSH